MAPTETRDRKRGKSRPSGRASDAPKRGGKPTLRTIAEMTGLAITTISRALNNAPELSEETRVRVQKIAAEIGYVPDRTALRLKTGRTHVIALILDPLEPELVLAANAAIICGLFLGEHIVRTIRFPQLGVASPLRSSTTSPAANPNRLVSVSAISSASLTQPCSCDCGARVG